MDRKYQIALAIVVFFVAAIITYHFSSEKDTTKSTGPSTVEPKAFCDEFDVNVVRAYNLYKGKNVKICSNVKRFYVSANRETPGIVIEGNDNRNILAKFDIEDIDRISNMEIGDSFCIECNVYDEFSTIMLDDCKFIEGK
jgi:uncharacterized protein (UPF0333 family)